LDAAPATEPASDEARTASVLTQRTEPANSRSAALAAKLRAARTTEAACTALEGLGWQGDATATTAIVDALRTRSTVEVKQCSLAALAHVSGDVAESLLLEASHDPNPAIRDEALASLAQHDDDLARSAVVAVAESQDTSARAGAVVALAGAAIPGAVQVVEHALSTATPTTQPRLLLALGQTGDRAAVPVLARFAEGPADYVRGAALRAAAAIGGSAMALLDAALRPTSADTRAAIEALGSVDTDDARSRLVRAADDPRPEVAASALDALASFDGEDVRAAVVLHVGSRHPAVATAAARWLALRGDGAAVGALVDAAQSSDGVSADSAMAALHGLGSEASRAAMLALASRPGVARARALRELLATPEGSDEARAIAVRMLRDEGGNVASTAVQLLEHDESPQATQALAEAARAPSALGQAAVSALGSRKDEASTLALIDLAREGGSRQTRRLALAQLSGSTDARAERALLEAAADPQLRESALTSLAHDSSEPAARALAKACGSSDPVERAAAARALLNQTPPALTPALNALARDADERVSRVAFEALQYAAPKEAEQMVLEGLRSTEADARSVAVSRAGQVDGEAVRPALIEALRDRDATVAAAAASALGAAGGSEAQQALLDVLTASSSSEDARHAAAEALADIGGAAMRDHGDLVHAWLPEGSTAGTVVDEPDDTEEGE
jgi:HEAT repeat protein